MFTRRSFKQQTKDGLERICYRKKQGCESLGLAPIVKFILWDGVIFANVTHEQLNNAHAHFPALLQISLGTPFAITLDDQVRRYHDIVVMAPNVMHSTDSEHQPYLALMIDPDHALYGHLYPLLNGE